MVRRYLIFGFLVLLACGASAQDIFHPAPPGSVARDVIADLSGDATHAMYHIVTSRAPVGKPAQDQWYLSVYAPSPDHGLGLLYQSPSDTDHYAVVPKLVQGHGTETYFPQETVSIAGKGQLMGEARDQVLVLVHAAAADCGMSTLSLLMLDGGAIRVPIQVSNLCSLSASVVHHTIVLRGPYYNATAPAYKPTKNNASATLRYVDGYWVERPQYFKLTYLPQVSATVTPLVKPSPLFTPIFKSIVTTPKPSGAPPPPR